MYRLIVGECGQRGKAAGFLIEVSTYDTVVRIGGTEILLHLYIYSYRKQILEFLLLYYR